MRAKKFLSAFAAFLAVCFVAVSAVSCKDDSDDNEEDKSVTVVFSSNSVLCPTIDGNTAAGVFISEKTAIDEDIYQFYVVIGGKSSGSNASGVWEFGMVDPNETEITENTTLIGIYKGTFTEDSKTTTLDRTHIIDSDYNWKTAAKKNWKKLDTSSSTFKVTLTNDDLSELETIFGY